ncbi:sugar ABC transporter substrate-binding protein [Nocardia yunnanensis]|uniref:Sugar ABC transporter substrate-binding protein n=1 Tax=Nocardia yunnanensis TaxID=2382165 RepID=A0A386ZNQ6_9NOCA|nr:sugar ABC transporter substrate-binding protein [Nocardia yunnanensis]AYF78983.1 sugar ABC transporter substrate-binding protein [Nocardia yunnanensis]
MSLKPATRAVLGVLLVAVLLVAAALWLGRDSDGGGRTVVRMRIWDMSFVAPYRAALDEFERANPEIEVRITQVPWSSYAQKLRLDAAGGIADDLFWTNLYEDYADSGHLLDIGAALGPDAARAWDPQAVAQYTRGGKLWAVPQFVDGGTAVYVNLDLLAQAGVDPAEVAAAHWSPDPGQDTFRPLLRRLAGVSTWPYNAANDFQSISLPYLGSAGGQLQRDGRFDIDSPPGRDAFGYTVGLVAAGLSPSAADTGTSGGSTNADFAKNAFLQGKLALFQSGTFNLATVARHTGFRWGLAMIPAGPAGRVSANNAIGLAGNAATAHPEAMRRVLAWLGSAAGNRYLGTAGATIPAVVSDQQVYRDYWAGHGVDVSPFFEVLRGTTIAAGGGTGFPAALQAMTPILDEMYLGRIPVADALSRAQREGNAALAQR